MIKFKVLKEEEDKMQSLIEKSGLTTTFTAQDVVDHLTHTRKTLRETNAQMEAEDIQNKMVEQFVPEVVSIPEDKLQMVMMYAARKIQRPDAIALKEACEKTIKSYEEQVELINKQLGLDIVLPVESPYQKHEDKETGDSETGEVISIEG